MVMDMKMETTVLQIFPGKKKTGSLHMEEQWKFAVQRKIGYKMME